MLLNSSHSVEKQCWLFDYLLSGAGSVGVGSNLDVSGSVSTIVTYICLATCKAVITATPVSSASLRELWPLKIEPIA